ncbi:hypothetical protein GQ457_15G003410 [Hibiscus cannabinus]
MLREVISRKVLVDEGQRQVVEVEQAAFWRFLWWSLVRNHLSSCSSGSKQRRLLSKDYFFRLFDNSPMHKLLPKKVVHRIHEKF